MQAANIRYVVLTVVLLAGAGLYAVLGEPLGEGTPRWPSTAEVYAAEAWSPVGAPSVEHSSNSTDLVTATFRHATGTTAFLTIVTNQAPKLYAAGAEVPFLGSGYTVATAPPELVPLGDTGVHALVARRGQEQWLLMYAYGERRGLLGNGARAWTLAILDGILARPNDYYKLYLVARADQLDAQLGSDVAGLAQTLFPNIAAWYAA